MTVSELLQSILPRLANTPASAVNATNIIDAVQATSEIITRRLWKRGSNLIKTLWTATSVNAETAYTSLPSGFLGFAEHPYISGETDYLMPLPENTRQTYTDSGHPEYYEITGTTITLYPTPDEAWVIKGMYYAAPTAVTAMSSSLPFGGLFDVLFRDAVLMIAERGLFVTADPVFEASVNSFVDGILSLRARRSAQWRYPA